MNINDVFTVTFRYTLSKSKEVQFEIPASAFFDMEFLTEYDEYSNSDKWSCDLPWENVRLNEYLDLTPGELKSLVSLVVDIVDHVKHVHRRIEEQRWESHLLIRYYDDLFKQGESSLLILQVVEKERDVMQSMHINLSAKSTEVRSHMRIWTNPSNEGFRAFKVPGDIL